MEPTRYDVGKGLFYRSGSMKAADLSRRIQMLTTVVLDLMMEVEALRETMVRGSNYRAAYREIGLLTHNSVGPSTGVDKLLDLYYPSSATSGGRAWRESLMMQRLGFTQTEMEQYKRDAEDAEQMT
jgi:hypothetical protein